MVKKETKDIVIKVRVTEEQNAMLVRGATLSHLELSTWIRQAALREADRLVTIVIERNVDEHLATKRARKGGK